MIGRGLSRLTRPGAALIHVRPSRRIHVSVTMVTVPVVRASLVCQYVPEVAGLDSAEVAAASMTCRPDRTGRLAVPGVDRSETTTAAAAVAMSPAPATIQRFLRRGLAAPPRMTFWSR